MMQPPSPACRYPLRDVHVAPEALVGATEAQIVTRLGRPDQNEAGTCWLAKGGHLPGTVVRESDGALRPLAVFGPVPAEIPPGHPYRVWCYHNVRGETWVIYLCDASAAVADAGPGSEVAPEIRGPSGFWQRVARVFRRQRNPVPSRRRGILRVVEVTHYPTGAVF